MGTKSGEFISSAASVDKEEVRRFADMADEWWDEDGKFKPLHKMNPVRISFIEDTIDRHFKGVKKEDLSLVDIGCGGGLIAEPMARLGIRTTAIDASERNIAVAEYHARGSGLDIEYISGSAEELAGSGRQYDIVLALEILEHVADVEVFLDACCRLVRSGGILIVATINRTLKSYLCAIVGAEYVMRWLPVGTHDWRKFLRPSEIECCVRKGGMRLIDIRGMSYHVADDSWSLCADSFDVNYMMVFGN